MRLLPPLLLAVARGYRPSSPLSSSAVSSDTGTTGINHTNRIAPKDTKTCPALVNVKFRNRLEERRTENNMRYSFTLNKHDDAVCLRDTCCEITGVQRSRWVSKTALRFEHRDARLSVRIWFHGESLEWSKIVHKIGGTDQGGGAATEPRPIRLCGNQHTTHAGKTMLQGKRLEIGDQVSS